MVNLSSILKSSSHKDFENISTVFIPVGHDRALLNEWSSSIPESGYGMLETEVVVEKDGELNEKELLAVISKRKDGLFVETSILTDDVGYIEQFKTDARCCHFGPSVMLTVE